VAPQPHVNPVEELVHRSRRWGWRWWRSCGWAGDELFVAWGTEEGEGEQSGYSLRRLL
jgi:hypothetical protein